VPAAHRFATSCVPLIRTASWTCFGSYSDSEPDWRAGPVPIARFRRYTRLRSASSGPFSTHSPRGPSFQSQTSSSRWPSDQAAGVSKSIALALCTRQPERPIRDWRSDHSRSSHVKLSKSQISASIVRAAHTYNFQSHRLVHRSFAQLTRTASKVTDWCINRSQLKASEFTDWCIDRSRSSYVQLPKSQIGASIARAAHTYNFQSHSLVHRSFTQLTRTASEVTDWWRSIRTTFKVTDWCIDRSRSSHVKLSKSPIGESVVSQRASKITQSIVCAARERAFQITQWRIDRRCS